MQKSQISRTALTCAALRARYTEMPFAREIFGYLQSYHPAGTRAISSMLAFGDIAFRRVSPNRYSQLAYVEGRYCSTSDALSRVGACHILEIASGLSPRGLCFDNGRVYVESDLPDIISQKKEIALQLGAKHLHFKALNPFDLESLLSVGREFFQDSDLPIAIVHEGFLGYFQDSGKYSKRTAIRNFRIFLQEFSPNGAYITPDLTFRKKKSPALKLLGFLASSIYRIRLYPFEDDKAALTLLKEEGFSAEFLPNSHLIQNLSCLKNFRHAAVSAAAHEYRACLARLSC